MSWITVGVTAASAIYGGIQADEQQKAQGKHNKAAAEYNRYSNWTGNRMDMQSGAPSTFSGAFGGGLAGFGASRGFLGQGGGGQDPTGAMTNKPTFTNSDNFSQQNLYNNPYSKMVNKGSVA